MPDRFGPLLREHRLARKVQQKDLAEALGISPQFLGDVERGYRPPLTPDRMSIAFTRLDLPDEVRNRLGALAAEERLAGVDLSHVVELVVDRLGVTKARGLFEKVISRRAKR